MTSVGFCARACSRIVSGGTREGQLDAGLLRGRADLRAEQQVVDSDQDHFRPILSSACSELECRKPDGCLVVRCRRRQRLAPVEQPPLITLDATNVRNSAAMATAPPTSNSRYRDRGCPRRGPEQLQRADGEQDAASRSGRTSRTRSGTCRRCASPARSRSSAGSRRRGTRPPIGRLMNPPSASPPMRNRMPSASST